MQHLSLTIANLFVIECIQKQERSSKVSDLIHYKLILDKEGDFSHGILQEQQKPQQEQQLQTESRSELRLGGVQLESGAKSHVHKQGSGFKVLL